MKKGISIIFLSLLFCIPAIAQNAEEFYKQASDFSDKDDFVPAYSFINKALGIDSTNAKYLLLKGNLLANSKRYQEAFNTYSYGINYNPTDDKLYNQRGLLLLRVGEPEFAIKEFTAALSFTKNDTDRLTLLLNKGAAEINIRDFQSAFNDFTQALQYDSVNIGVLNNLATVCDEVGKGDMTLKYLYKIIEIDPTFIGAYGNIGFKFQEMGDYKTAIKYFNKTIELSPDDAISYGNRAYNRYKLGDLDSALIDINYSIKLYPSNSYSYRTRALIYLELKDKIKACKDIEDALRFGFTKMYGDTVEQLKKDNCL